MSMLSSSTVQLLRIPFSFFLSPIYLFSLSLVPDIHWPRAMLVFFILHFLIYPASNGYNSYMDRDTESIGGLERPPPPTRQLFMLTIILDIAGILLSLLVSPLFALVMLFYIAASKAYSYRGVRLKRFPYISYIVVIAFQGAVTCWLVYYGSNRVPDLNVPWQGLLICALLVGGFYPLTQIYQHQQDIKDGVATISYRLGYTGTFLLCAVIYLLVLFFMAQFFILNGQEDRLWVTGIFFIPVIVYFIRWFIQVRKDLRAASFKNTMKMNWIAATCTNISFFILLIWRWF